jgi:hypothetical protein
MTAYTPWHVARLRDRLARYRAFEGENGRSQTWIGIADDIRDFETPAFRAQEPSEKVLAEALRRFCEGKHVLRSARLDAVAVFLKSKGYFFDADIEQSPGGYELALAVLSQTGGPEKPGPPVAYGIYHGAVRHGPAGNAVSTLELLQSDDPALSPSVRIPERTYHPGRPMRFAGYHLEHRDGWFVRRNPEDAFALVESRHKKEQLIYFLPHIPAEGISSPMLAVVKLDRFVPPRSPVPDSIPSADLLPRALSQWAADRTWRYWRDAPPSEEASSKSRPGSDAHGFAPDDDDGGAIALTMNLYEAAAQGFGWRVEYLLRSGEYDINAREDGTGSTALHYAAANDAIDALRVLAGYPGCDFTLADKEGRTAATLAYEIAENPVTGRFLLTKERKQHLARGTRPDHSSWYRPAKA